MRVATGTSCLAVFLDYIGGVWISARAGIIARLASNGPRQLTRGQYAVISITILLVALGVRILYWQDTAVEMSVEDTLSQNMARQYRREARRILEDGRILYPRAETDPGNAMLIVHPPGYSMLMALCFKLFGERESPLRWFQLVCDASQAVLILIIAAELLPMGIAVIAAALMALSPHAAYYSLRLSPDSLAVLPVLIAIYLVIRATKHPRSVTVISAGLLLGLSCWLRANALLLAPFLALAATILFERGKRFLYASLVVAATLLVISPITIRNWIVYHRFIPIALPAGVNLVQGIAEFDREGRFGMPLTDPDVLTKDVEWNARTDYGGHMWAPDGIERDRTRFDRGLAVIRSHPLWYLGTVIRRAGFMLSYNEARKRDWPFNTATVPIVSATPPFGHMNSTVSDKIPVLSVTPDLLSRNSDLSSHAEASLIENGDVLRINGGGADFDDQITSTEIAVTPNTDYIIVFSVNVVRGAAAARITGPGEYVLASSIIPFFEPPVLEPVKRQGRIQASEPGANGVAIPFASGNTSEIHWVISNNGDAAVRPVIDLAKFELFELGPTPSLWTHYPRLLVRGIERNIFKTDILLPLIIMGAGVLFFARRGRVLLILLLVPAYYLATHAPFSTEYRYVLAIHCFLFVIAAVGVYTASLLVGNVLRLSARRGAFSAKGSAYGASESL